MGKKKIIPVFGFGDEWPYKFMTMAGEYILW